MTNLKELLEQVKARGEFDQRLDTDSQFISGAHWQYCKSKTREDKLLEIIEGLMGSLELFPLSEMNQKRLDQVPIEQLRMIVLHGSSIARTAQAAALEKLEKLR